MKQQISQNETANISPKTANISPKTANILPKTANITPKNSKYHKTKQQISHIETANKTRIKRVQVCFRTDHLSA